MFFKNIKTEIFISASPLQRKAGCVFRASVLTAMVAAAIAGQQARVFEPVTLESVVHASTVIVEGRMRPSTSQQIADATDTTIETTFAVDRVLKGQVSLPTITVIVPSEREVLLTAGRYRIAFLTKDGNSYQKTSQLYGIEPALRSTSSSVVDLVGESASLIIGAIQGGRLDDLDRSLAFSIITTCSDPTATALLRSYETNPSRTYRLEAIAGLLRTGKAGPDTFAAIEDEIASGPGDINDQGLINMMAAMVLGPGELPGVLKLNSAASPFARAGAATILHDFPLASVAAALKSDLNDPQFEVRHSAAERLASLSGQHQWAPRDFQAFQLNEALYIRFWNEWLDERFPDGHF